MTKHAFTTSMTAHVWAQRSQDSGYTSGGSLRFEYDVLRAYSTVVAILVDGADGRTHVIHRRHVRCTGFAPNYGRLAQDASSQYPAFSVEDLNIFGHSTCDRLSCNDEHTKRQLGELLDSLVADFRATVADWSNVNKHKWADATQRGSYVRDAAHSVHAFAKAFGLTAPAGLDVEAETAVASIAQAIEAREAKANAPETIAKRKNSRASKETRQRRFDDEFKAWLKYGTKRPPLSAHNNEFSNLARRHVKSTIDDDERAFKWQNNYNNGEYVPRYAWDFTRPLRTWEKKFKDAKYALQSFREYGFTLCYDAEKVGKAFKLLVNVTTETERENLVANLNRAQLEKEIDANFAAFNPNASNIVLRRNRARWERKPDITPEQWQAGAGNMSQWHFEHTYVRRRGERLETSRGAEAPFSQAVAIFLKAQQCRELGKAWRPNGERFKAGVFELDSIDETGGINIGCHRVEFDEMQRLALLEIPAQVKNYPLALAA